METKRRRGRRSRLAAQCPNRLREFRERLNYSKEELAQRIGVRVTSLNNAELYGRCLGKRSWYKLADLFGVDPRILESPPPGK